MKMQKVKVKDIKTGMTFPGGTRWIALEDVRHLETDGHYSLKVQYTDSDGSYGWRHWVDGDHELLMEIPAPPKEEKAKKGKGK